MPQLTSEQQDALQEAISKQLYRINNLVKGMFGQELSDEEIQRAHGRIMGGVQQGIRQLEQKKTQPPIQTTQPFPPSPDLPISTFAEGGFVNDSSGVHTAELRRKLGIPGGGP